MYSTDILFYSLHTIMHLKQLHYYRLVAVLGLLLVVADFYRLLNRCFDLRIWLQIYRFRCEHQDETSKQPNKFVILPSKISIALKVSREHYSPFFFPGKQGAYKETGHHKNQKILMDRSIELDYPTIYKHLELNHGILSHTYLLLRTTPRAYRSIIARCSFLLRFLRLALFQVVIVCCQYTPFLLLSIFSIFELLYVTSLMVSGFRHKWFHSKLEFILVLSPSIFMLGFLVVCWMANSYIYHSDVPDYIQISGAVLIVISAFLETFFLILSILANLIEYIKYKRSPQPDNKKKSIVIRRDSISDNPIFMARANPASPRSPSKSPPIMPLPSHRIMPSSSSRKMINQSKPNIPPPINDNKSQKLLQIAVKDIWASRSSRRKAIF